MNLTNYLDRELGRNNGPDNFESDLTELIGVDGYLEFQDICNNLNYTCSNTYSSTEDLINAENDFYNFMYSSEELSNFLISKRRETDEESILFVEPILVPGNILDIGCGSGIKSVYFALNKIENVYAMDKLDSALKLTNKLKDKYDINNLITLQDDLLSFVMNKKINNILALNMLHESGDNRDIPYGSLCLETKIRNIYNHLENGGKFISTLQVSSTGQMDMSVIDEMDTLDFKNLDYDIIKELENDSKLVGIIGSK